MLQDFINAFKNEYANKNMFVFTDFPEFITRKEYSRKDYDQIIKVILKVKTRFIAERI